jgi:hypothetical protein
MSAHTYISIYVYTVFLKKIKLHSSMEVLCCGEQLNTDCTLARVQASAVKPLLAISWNSSIAFRQCPCCPYKAIMQFKTYMVPRMATHATKHTFGLFQGPSLAIPIHQGVFERGICINTEYDPNGMHLPLSWFMKINLFGGVSFIQF